MVALPSFGIKSREGEIFVSDKKLIDQLVPESFETPHNFLLAGVPLYPLSLDDLLPDFEAVLESRDRLVGLFSELDPWPNGLTLRENAVDLAWHEKEFERRTSFAWGVWSAEKRLLDNGRDSIREYLGCAYLQADRERQGVVRAIHWIRTGCASSDFTRRFDAAWREWVVETWPFDQVSFVSPESLS